MNALVASIRFVPVPGLGLPVGGGSLASCFSFTHPPEPGPLQSATARGA
jgi:hypothetical protein